MCVHTLPTGKDLGSPRGQTETAAEGMLALPKWLCRIPAVMETAFPTAQMGLSSLHPAQEKYVFAGKGENSSSNSAL